MVVASQTNSACCVAELLPIICFYFLALEINIIMNIFVQDTLEIPQVGLMRFKNKPNIYFHILY